MPGAQVIPRPAAARPGDPAPWAHLPPERRRGIGLDRVRRALARTGPAVAWPPLLPVELDTPRQAAVLVTLFEERGEARVVLTRRSSRLRAHSGEVAFPGGRADEGEDLLAAALREATEEVGLDPTAVEVVGELGRLSTWSSRAFITPFVGLLAARPHLVASPAEVELVFDVALAELLADGVYREELWGDHDVHFFELEHDTVWGATARMLRELLEAVTLA